MEGGGQKKGRGSGVKWIVEKDENALKKKEYEIERFVKIRVRARERERERERERWGRKIDRKIEVSKRDLKWFKVDMVIKIIKGRGGRNINKKMRIKEEH